MSATDTVTVPTVGDRAKPRQFGPLTRTDFVKYQGASGDFHPLRHDETYAHAAGFPSVFSVGMLQAGLLAAYRLTPPPSDVRIWFYGGADDL
jgi:acyl dehydratase